jgi:hypothetical protein
MRDIEQIIESIKKTSPEVTVRQVEVLHPGADDDGLWFFSKISGELEVQIESSTGMCPFLIETDENDTRGTTSLINETINMLSSWLHL